MAPMFKSGLKAYKAVETESTAHGGRGAELVVLLYDGIIESLVAGKACLERKEYREVGRHFARAMTIISGLRETLDFDNGQPVAQDLLRFYNALTSQVIHAQTQRDIELLDQCLTWVKSVREAWGELARRAEVAPVQTREKVEPNRLAAARSGAAVAAAC